MLDIYNLQNRIVSFTGQEKLLKEVDSGQDYVFYEYQY